MRCLTLIAFTLVASGSAFASYELMLLPTSNGRVARFDPVSQIGLGQYGPTNGAILRGQVNYRASDGISWLTTSGGTTSFDTGTGTPVNSSNFPSGITRISPEGGRLFEVDGVRIYRTDPDTLAQNSTNVPNAAAFNFVAPYSNNSCLIGYADSNLNNFVISYNAVTNTFGTALAVGLGFTAGSFGGAQSLKVGSSMTYRTIGKSGGTNVIATFASTDGINYNQSFLSLGALPQFSSTATLSMMLGHGNTFYVVGDDISAATTTRISWYRSDGTNIGTYTTTAVDVPTGAWSGYSIIAPEPSSLGLLAVSALMLMRRRKKA
ncbi:MAG: PEP-CTERM sorting domain-containing protein [Chthonomonas sp.]|nr:PEP-CTERM sorting domain-containing protein [Chthonomonas sp.]